MLNPYPEGTDVRVRISHKGKTFTAFGNVVFVLPNMGMGVVFRSVEENQLAILQEWISKLSRAEQGLVHGRAIGERSERGRGQAHSHAGAALVINFLRRGSKEN